MPGLILTPHFWDVFSLLTKPSLLSLLGPSVDLGTHFGLVQPAGGGHKKKWSRASEIWLIPRPPHPPQLLRVTQQGTAGVTLPVWEPERVESEHTKILFSGKMKIMQLSPHSCIQWPFGLR